MINQALLNPDSIVVVGGSNDTGKPGGKILQNIIDGRYNGELHVVNPKTPVVQGIACLPSVEKLESVDLAILSVAAQHCPQIVQTLAAEKNTRAFIILSAGFGEESEQGKRWETEITNTVNSVGGCLIGPNCIGILNSNYSGIFTSPVPPLDARGCDLISSSGATAVFLLEAGILLGLKFAGVYSVGNSAQTGVEEVLEYMDLNHDPESDSHIKLLYLESVADPEKLLKHAASLIRKGVRIAAIKAGSTEAGERAAASHTGAMTNPDTFVRALFRKAGIVYCSSRSELLSVASVFNYRELTGKNIAVISHAGGPAVMLTDCLCEAGLEVPAISGPLADELLAQLHPGSSVSNPIDFLATGTAAQLETIIDYCDNKFDQVDAMVVIFGSPGLFDVAGVYRMLARKLDDCRKPVYPVLPSVINAREGIEEFLSNGHINFADEVILGKSLASVYDTPAPAQASSPNFKVDEILVRQVIDGAPDGFLSPAGVSSLLDAAGIPRPAEQIVATASDIGDMTAMPDFPVAMKVIGPLHKTDVGGIVLNVNSTAEMQAHFKKLMQIEQATGVLIQPMVSGMELFAGVQREAGFGHLVACGLGGVFIEVLNDFSTCLAPVSKAESIDMIRGLQAYGVISGTRGKEGVNQDLFSEIIQRLSLLVEIAPEIVEMDINPLMATMSDITAVDTRIRIKKQP